MFDMPFMNTNTDLADKYTPIGSVEMPGEIYSQDITFAKYSLYNTKDPELIEEIKSTFNDPDYIAKGGTRKVTDIISPQGEVSVIKVVVKSNLINDLLSSNIGKRSRMQQMSTRIAKETNSNTFLDKYIDEAKENIGDALDDMIANAFTGYICMNHCTSEVIDKATGQEMETDELLKWLEDNNVVSENDADENSPPDPSKTRAYIKKALDMLAESNHIEFRLVYTLVLGDYIQNEIESKNTVAFKMSRFGNLISKTLMKNTIFKAAMDDAGIQCEYLLNNIMQKLWETPFTAANAFITMVEEEHPHEIIDIISTADDTVLPFKKEFQESLQKVGYAVCNKKLVVGGNLAVRTIYIPNLSLDKDVLVMSKISSLGTYYMILERYNDTELLRKIFTGGFNQIMTKTADFIKDNEKALVTSSF